MIGIADTLDVLMFLSLCILLVSGFPVAFVLAGNALIFALIGYALGVFDLTFISLLPQRIYGTMTNEVLIAVPLFVFMGVMLERSRVAADLLESMGRLFGTMRGGLGISVTVVGALLAASTGIVGATVVTMGLLSLPTMLRYGYDRRLACGSICAAGTLGQIIPPSIVLVLLGDSINSAYQIAQRAQGLFSTESVSVGDLFVGAIIPGLTLVALYVLYQIAIAILRPETSPALPPDPELAALSRLRLCATIARVLLPPIFLIVAVLGSILGGIATPTEAAAVGSIGALMLAGMHMTRSAGVAVPLAIVSLGGLIVLTAFMDLRITRLSIPATDLIGIAAALVLCAAVGWGIAISLYRVWHARVLHAVVHTTAQVSSMVFVILIGAAMFSLVFRGLGGDETVRHFLTSMPGGEIGALIVVMAVMFLMGFFLDFIEIIFIVVPIVAPVLLQMGYDPIWLAIMMAVNLQTSFLTPPFGFALFYLRGVTPPEVSTGDIYRGIVPFVAIQLLGLGLLAAFPILATWLPNEVLR